MIVLFIFLCSIHISLDGQYQNRLIAAVFSLSIHYQCHYQSQPRVFDNRLVANFGFIVVCLITKWAVQVNVVVNDHQMDCIRCKFQNIPNKSHFIRAGVKPLTAVKKQQQNVRKWNETKRCNRNEWICGEYVWTEEIADFKSGEKWIEPKWNEAIAK